MYWMLLPLDPNAPRHIEDHPVPPSGSLSDLFHDCWSAVLSLLTPAGDQASHRAPRATCGARRAGDGVLGTENSARRSKYLELRAKYLARRTSN